VNPLRIDALGSRETAQKTVVGEHEIQHRGEHLRLARALSQIVDFKPGKRQESP